MTKQSTTAAIFRRGAPSVQSDLANHDLVLTWHDFLADSGEPEIIVRIPVEEIPDLLNTLVNHGTIALRQAAQALVLGDCSTCSNTRLVERPVANARRTEQVHCPDCWRPSAGFADAPTVGPSVKEGW